MDAQKWQMKNLAKILEQTLSLIVFSFAALISPTKSTNGAQNKLTRVSVNLNRFFNSKKISNRNQIENFC